MLSTIYCRITNLTVAVSSKTAVKRHNGFDKTLYQYKALITQQNKSLAINRKNGIHAHANTTTNLSERRLRPSSLLRYQVYNSGKVNFEIVKPS